MVEGVEGACGGRGYSEMEVGLIDRGRSDLSGFGFDTAAEEAIGSGETAG